MLIERQIIPIKGSTGILPVKKQAVPSTQLRIFEKPSSNKVDLRNASNANSLTIDFLDTSNYYP